MSRSSTSRPMWPTAPPSGGSWPTCAPEAIYHLAAMTHVGESWENPGQVLRVNVLGTAEILAAARSVDGQPPRPGRQLGRGLRRRRPRPTTARRGHPHGAGQPLRGQQAGGRGGGAAGLARLRPARRRRAALQPHRARASRPTSSCPRWPSGSWRPVGAGRARCGWATSRTRRDFTDVRDVVAAYRLLVEQGDPRRASTTCAQDVTWPCRRWRLSCSSWRRPTSRSQTDPALVRPGRRAGVARRCGPAAGGDGLAARHPARDNARRRPGLVGGGLTASVVGTRGVRWLRRSRAGGSGSAPHEPGSVPSPSPG